MEIVLQGEAATLPAEINVAEIAEDACQAAFALIAARLEIRGYPVTGDFGPGEVAQLDRVFDMFVRSMAQNNETIAAMNDEDDDGDWVLTLPEVGSRVRFTETVERYPHFTVSAGSVGKVVDVGDPCIYAVRLDETLPGAEDWGNQVHWSLDAGEDPRDALESLPDDPPRKLVAIYDVSELTEQEASSLAGAVYAQAEANDSGDPKFDYPDVPVRVEIEPPYPPQPTREILVHLNITVPGEDNSTANEIADAVVGVLAKDERLEDLEIVAPLAEEI